MKDLSVLSDLIHEHKLTSEELVSLCIRNERKELRAIQELNPEALKEAQKLDRETEFRSALHGIPIVIKDNVSVKGLHMTFGSLVFKDYVPEEDALIVKRLREAGMVILGKSALSEFGYWMDEGMPNGYSSANGQIISPFGKDIDPKGSSTGSAVAVASGMVPCAIGNETNGSLIGPGRANCIVSFKPGVGVVSGEGCMTMAPMCDTCGPMAQTVEDCRLLMEILTGKKFDTVDVSKIIVGILSFDDSPDTVKETEARELLTAYLKAHDISFRSVSLPVSFVDDYMALTYEFKEGMNTFLKTHDCGLKSLEDIVAYNNAHPEECLKYGQGDLLASLNTTDTSDPEYLEARRKTSEEAAAYNHLLDTFELDLTVAVHTSDYAPLTGNPCLTVPVIDIKDDNCEPVSYFITGLKGADELVLSFGKVLETIRYCQNLKDTDFTDGGIL